MGPIEVLMSEHRVIEGVLDTLNRSCALLARDERVPAEVFLTAADFIRNFADSCHHAKEEGVLFKTMGEYGMTSESGPVGVMLYEHEVGRGYTRQMAAAAKRYGDGDKLAIPEIINNARGYTGLLSDHIVKEDQILYPTALSLIGEETLLEMTPIFERAEVAAVGADGHERYIALATRMKTEIDELEKTTARAR